MTKELPRFIWGEATDFMTESTLVEDVLFLTHTQHPQFTCRVYEIDEIVDYGSTDGTLAGWFEERDGQTVWASNAGIRVADYPMDINQGVLHLVLMDAAADYQLYADAYGHYQDD
jgi:hypothetical protein